MNDQAFRSAAFILQAKTAALVGASDRSPWARIIFHALRQFGFPGDLYLVNPRYSSLWGEPCYPSLSALPKPPDHAMVIIPAEGVLETLQDGTRTGLKSATVYAANLGEGADATIVARGTALKELCARTGLVVAGPNCMGSMSMRERYFAYPNFPDSELCTLPPGSVAGIFQSGGTMQIWGKAAADRGLRFSYLISSGNELNLDLADYLKFLVEDAHTRTIVLFIEGIRRPAAFMAAASKALAAGKPIIAIKTGKSQPSRDAAQSHTGAIAGDYEVFTAMCERYGINLCDTLDDVLEHVLAFQPGRLPKGRRIGVFTTSGGTVDLLHDCVAQVPRLEMPAFSATTEEGIRALIVADKNHKVAVRNPLDAGNPAGDKNAAAISRVIVSDRDVDMLAWAGQAPVGKAGSRDATALRGVFDATEKPIVCFSRLHHSVDAESVAFQEKSGIPFLHDIGAALRALSALAFYGERIGRTIGSLPEPNGTPAGLVGDALRATLNDHGLTPPAGALAEGPEEAVQAALEIGFPVALKIQSPAISHKTEIGGVRLDLRTPQEVKREAAALIATVARIDPNHRVDGVLVQAMVDGPEFILGARHDPLYGPVLVLGAGGTLVELLGDTSFRLLPIGPAEAREMIGELKVAKVLSGYRNKPACDVEALIAAMCGLSKLYLDFRHILSDFEINPLVVRPCGDGVRAVDVRMTFRSVTEDRGRHEDAAIQ